MCCHHVVSCSLWFKGQVLIPSQMTWVSNSESSLQMNVFVMVQTVKMSLSLVYAHHHVG